MEVANENQTKPARQRKKKDARAENKVSQPNRSHSNWTGYYSTNFEEALSINLGNKNRESRKSCKIVSDLEFPRKGLQETSLSKVNLNKSALLRAERHKRVGSLNPSMDKSAPPKRNIQISIDIPKNSLIAEKAHSPQLTSSQIQAIKEKLTLEDPSLSGYFHRLDEQIKIINKKITGISDLLRNSGISEPPSHGQLNPDPNQNKSTVLEKKSEPKEKQARPPISKVLRTNGNMTQKATPAKIESNGRIRKHSQGNLSSSSKGRVVPASVKLNMEAINKAQQYYLSQMDALKQREYRRNKEAEDKHATALKSCTFKPMFFKKEKTEKPRAYIE